MADGLDEATRHLERLNAGRIDHIVLAYHDRASAIESVNDNGGRAEPLAATTPPGALRRYAVTREAVVGEIGAINVLLGEFALQPESAGRDRTAS